MWLTNSQRAATTDVWLTPKPIIDDLGPFDLDPCAAGAEYAWRPWETARESWTWGGLDRPWHGLCWVNPPYSDTEPWMARLAEHGPGGVALLFARTETKTFFDSIWNSAGGFLFLKGRVRFCTPGGHQSRSGMGPSVLIGYGDTALRRLANSRLEGHLLVQSFAVLVTPDGARVGTWKEAIEAAGAGRTLRLRELYAAAEGTAKVRAAKEAGHDWRAQIRRALQEHFPPVARGVWRTA